MGLDPAQIGDKIGQLRTLYGDLTNDSQLCPE
jgi:hypothetical protein